jgi:hypothetical protein
MGAEVPQDFDSPGAILDQVTLFERFRPFLRLLLAAVAIFLIVGGTIGIFRANLSFHSRFTGDLITYSGPFAVPMGLLWIGFGLLLIGRIVRRRWRAHFLYVGIGFLLSALLTQAYATFFLS